MVIKASKTPESLTVEQIDQKFLEKLSKTKNYHKDEPTHTIGGKDKSSKKYIYIILLCILLIASFFGIFLYYRKRNTTNYNMLLSPISSSYTPSTANSYHPSTPN
jgi:hypothetical protein